MTTWRTDVLGAGFEWSDIPLGRDSEGELVATLVRSLPSKLSRWDRLRGRERQLEHVDGSAEGLVYSGFLFYAASTTRFSIAVANSIGVSLPSARCLRLR